MGYSTRHDLSVSGENDLEIIAELRNECEDAHFALKENGEASDGYKWYDSDYDLKMFSKKHPERLFTLHCEGEEPLDVYNAYFKDGKMQHCPAIISFEPFDGTKLK